MRHPLLLSLVLTMLCAGASAEEVQDPTSEATGAPPPGRPAGSVVSPTLAGGAVHQFSTDLEDAGDFSVSRFFIRPGLDFFFGPRLQASLNLGYTYDRYDFGGGKGTAGEPWDDVNSFRLSAFTRFALNETVTVFGVPAIQSAAERGASLSDGVTYGIYAGASWKLSDSLTLGPGAGFFSEIEDSGVFFPFLLIDWQFAEKWAVRTGRGLSATRGPGLVVEWEFADQWSVSVGGRWEQLRFRLDDDPIAPEGVGEEESVPLFLALTHQLGDRSSVSLLAGVNLNGSVSIFDKNGHRLDRQDYDPAPFLGLAFSLTF